MEPTKQTNTKQKRGKRDEKLITVGKWTLSQTEDGRKVITHQGVSAAFMVRLNGTDLTIIPRNVKAIAGECISEYLSETQEVANFAHAVRGYFAAS